MADDHRLAPSWLRRSALAAVAAVGLLTIVGSGGGGDAPQCSFFSNVCNPVITPPSAAPAVSIAPLKLAVQAGASAAFVARTRGIDQPQLQWRRSADGGVTYVDIAGATSANYTLTQAQFADDGALFRVDVRANGGNAVSASSNAVTLLVSSTSALVFADGEFDPADWSSSAIADPAQNGPTHSEDRSASGGALGAFRHMSHTMTAGPSSLRVFNLKTSAVYDPHAQGAIHAIDYSEDCGRLAATSNAITVLSFPMIEQGGRRYVSGVGRGCLSDWVNNFDQLPSLVAADLLQVDGPPCGSGESCPDFSAGGALLRFGFERRVMLPAGAAAGSIDHGIDNWKIGVWRN
jgi:hypothetical protein